MSYAADPVRNSGLSFTARLGDFALRLTTRHATDDALALAEGWQLRLASPAWHGLWAQDADRLKRLGVVVLPEQIISLDDEERRALVSDRLRELGAGPGVPERLKLALTRARARLAARLSWLD